MVLVALFVFTGIAAAQPAPPLLEAYGRAIALLNFMTSYVGQTLLACAERNLFTEAQAEARFAAYRQRNAALLERAGSWRAQAEKRLHALGHEEAARERADAAGMSAASVALARVKREIDKANDVRALCAARVEGIESGRYDLSVNPDFVGLLKENP